MSHHCQRCDHWVSTLQPGKGVTTLRPYQASKPHQVAVEWHRHSNNVITHVLTDGEVSLRSGLDAWWQRLITAGSPNDSCCKSPCSVRSSDRLLHQGRGHGPKVAFINPPIRQCAAHWNKVEERGRRRYCTSVPPPDLQPPPPHPLSTEQLEPSQPPAKPNPHPARRPE